jgi:hypothetical protein
MIGRVLGRIALVFIYFVVVTPIALVRRLVAGNPLRHEAGELGYWLPHGSAHEDDASMRKQS